MTSCPSCDAEIVFDDDAEEGEIIECPECGVELEIISVDPPEVQEAPEEEEERCQGDDQAGEKTPGLDRLGVRRPDHLGAHRDQQRCQRLQEWT